MRECCSSVANVEQPKAPTKFRYPLQVLSQCCRQDTRYASPIRDVSFSSEKWSAVTLAVIGYHYGMAWEMYVPLFFFVSSLPLRFFLCFHCSACAQVRDLLTWTRQGKRRPQLVTLTAWRFNNEADFIRLLATLLSHSKSMTWISLKSAHPTEPVKFRGCPCSESALN